MKSAKSVQQILKEDNTMTKTVAKQETKPIEKQAKSRPMDFTLCITVLLLLALRNCYGVVGKFSVCISRVAEIVMLMFLDRQYLQ